MEIAQEVIAINTTGGAGTSGATVTTPAMMGWLEDIFVDWNASAPATADITISLPRGGNVWALQNSSTDVLVAPRVKPVDNANAAITNSFEKFVLNGSLTIVIAQSNDLSPSATVYVRYLRP